MQIMIYRIELSLVNVLPARSLAIFFCSVAFCGGTGKATKRRLGVYREKKI